MLSVHTINIGFCRWFRHRALGLLSSPNHAVVPYYHHLPLMNCRTILIPLLTLQRLHIDTYPHSYHDDQIRPLIVQYGDDHLFQYFEMVNTVCMPSKRSGNLPSIKPSFSSITRNSFEPLSTRFK